MRTTHSLYQMVTCLQEYADLLAHPRGTATHGVSGSLALAQKYNISSNTLKRWARTYAHDMHLFGKDKVELLHRIGSLEMQLERVKYKYDRMRKERYAIEPSPMYYYHEARRLREESDIFKRLYEQSRARCDVLARRDKVLKTDKYRLKQAYEKLRQAAGHNPPHKRDISRDGAGDVHRSP